MKIMANVDYFMIAIFITLGVKQDSIFPYILKWMHSPVLKKEELYWTQQLSTG